MMEFIYPAFEQGRIMKKELMLALRDYSYSALQIRYSDYSEGILQGCGLRVEEKYIAVLPGIFKCRDFIFLLSQEEKVKYERVDQYCSLKICVSEKKELADYTKYCVEIKLDEILERSEGEIELARFYLKRGFDLRDEYENFQDIQTQYDTLNLADSTWSGRGGCTLSKKITDYYAKEILKCYPLEAVDMQFACLCLQSTEAVSKEIIESYIIHKLGTSCFYTTKDMQELFAALSRILDQISSQSNNRTEERKQPRRIILVE